MDNITIINLLTNSGLKVFGIDDHAVYFQDPSCIFPAFDTIIEYAWLAIVIMLAIIIIGWGVLYIKNGVKAETTFNNVKTLTLVLATMAMVKPAVNIVYGDDLFAKQCEEKQVSLKSVQELLDMRNKKFGKQDEYTLSENFSMVDSGPVYSETMDGAPSNTETEKSHSSETASGTSLNTEIEEQETYEDASEDIAFVQADKNEVIYEKKDGTKVKRSGGSRAWRNNNPGNIIKSEFAYKNGAIGESGRFAVFPDEETGLRATMNLLQSKNYRSLRLSEVYQRWAPAGDGNNNPNSYANKVSKMSGIALNARIQDLNDNQVRSLARSMQVIEGWTPGTEERI